MNIEFKSTDSSEQQAEKIGRIYAVYKRWIFSEHDRKFLVDLKADVMGNPRPFRRDEANKKPRIITESEERVVRKIAETANLAEQLNINEVYLINGKPYNHNEVFDLVSRLNSEVFLKPQREELASIASWLKRGESISAGQTIMLEIKLASSDDLMEKKKRGWVFFDARCNETIFRYAKYLVQFGIYGTISITRDLLPRDLVVFREKYFDQEKGRVIAESVWTNLCASRTVKKKNRYRDNRTFQATKEIYLKALMSLENYLTLANPKTHEILSLRMARPREH